MLILMSDWCWRDLDDKAMPLMNICRGEWDADEELLYEKEVTWKHGDKPDGNINKDHRILMRSVKSLMMTLMDTTMDVKLNATYSNSEKGHFILLSSYIDTIFTLIMLFGTFLYFAYMNRDKDIVAIYNTYWLYFFIFLIYVYMYYCDYLRSSIL